MGARSFPVFGKGRWTTNLSSSRSQIAVRIILAMNRHLKRYYGYGHLHFITFSCYRRQPLLAQASVRDQFLKILEEVRCRYRFVVVGYVVMPEHVHLLINEPELGTSLAIQVL